MLSPNPFWTSPARSNLNDISRAINRVFVDAPDDALNVAVLENKLP
jgi:hypothetical protein